MATKTAFSKFTFLAIIILTLTGCQKENSWNTTIEIIYNIEPGSVNIEADYYLPRNDNYVYVGVCLSTSEDPTTSSYFYKDKQELDSDLNGFYFEGLSPNTLYYARSFIIRNDGHVIYSENKTFTTALPPDAPCETIMGRIQFDELSYVMDDLDESPSDDYKISTSCSFGELHFTFNNRPSANVYTTVSTPSDLTNTSVHIDGIFGGVFSCYYRASSGYSVYVKISETDKISIEMCDVVIWPSGSCEDSYTLLGEVHE